MREKIGQPDTHCCVAIAAHIIQRDEQPCPGHGDLNLFLGLNDEQHLLCESFAKLFASHSTATRVREVLPTGFDAALWSELVAMGVPAMRVAEVSGGLDLPLFETVLMMQEAGRRLASVPLAEIVVAARLLAQSGEPGAGWLKRLMAGDVIVVPAIEPLTEHSRQIVMGAVIAHAVLALDGDELVLLERAGDVQLEANVAGLPLARLAGNFTANRLVILRGAAAREAMAQTIEEWRLLTAALLVGLAGQALKDAAAYACERIAFGRPIGKFQGIAHPLAESYTDIEGGRLLIWKVVAAIASRHRDAAALNAMAWAWVAEKTIAALRRSLRTLGGYGLSLEYDMALYHRRATGYVLLGGDSERLLDLAGRRLFLDEAASLPDAGRCGISFGLDESTMKKAQETAAFILANQTEAMREKAHHSTASHNAELHRKLAQGGFIASCGGGEEPQRALERFAILGELEAAGYTTHVIATTELVGKVVDLFGSKDARAEIVAAIKAGEAIGALGFSEPGAGSDVFAAQTQAIRSGDDWIINGQKMFTTAGHIADYVLVLARSEPGSQGHKGLTLFVVPTTLPGFSHQPIHTYQDERTNITFFADVTLPDRYRLGEVAAGSYVMGEVLKLEQSAATILYHGQAQMIAAARRWAERREGGVAPLDRPEIRRRLTQVMTRFEVAHCFVIRDLWAADQGISDRSFGPMSKLFVTEAHLDNSWQVLQMAGAEGLLTGKHDLGIVELGHRRAYAETIYAGTNEIHRSLIAEQALGLPKSRV